jgi:hypothetical protein
MMVLSRRRVRNLQSDRLKDVSEHVIHVCPWLVEKPTSRVSQVYQNLAHARLRCLDLLDLGGNLAGAIIHQGFMSGGNLDFSHAGTGEVMYTGEIGNKMS